MSLATEDLCDIVARSSTVFERVAMPFVRVATPDAERLIQARLDTWKQRVGAGSDERFRRYLAWCGWDEADARCAVGPCVYVGEHLPAWTEVLKDLGRDESRPAGSGIAGSVVDEEPFVHALLPFVEAAQRRLNGMESSSGGWLEPGMRRAFERALLRRLSRIAGRTLLVEFRAFGVGHTSAAVHTDGLRDLDVALAGGTRAVYTRFIRWMDQGGRAALLRRYPVLARCLGTRVVDWADATSEFARRLEADRPALERMFAGGQAIGAAIDADAELSDPHGGGRTVVRVIFASGLTLVYKPRSLEPERAFSALIEWLNDGRIPLALKAPRVLDCGTHGWMEFVASEPCRDAAEVSRYYRRIGMLLSLAHILGAADLHRDNVIACGEFPVLVDLEVLMTSPIRTDPWMARSAHDPAGQEIWDSVLRTGLLPINRLGVRGEVRRDGGVMHGPDAPARAELRWSRVNTDFMTLTADVAPPATDNTPSVAGEPARAEDHVDELIAGFVEMRHALRREQRALVDGDALDAFRRQRTRVVIRATEMYAAVLQRVLHPRLLHDGAEWSIELDVLKSACTPQPTRPALWSAAVAEGRALSQLDVPLFETCSEDTHLRVGDRVVAREFLTEPGYAATLSRLSRLTDEDVRAHTQCIRLATQCARTPSADAPDVMREARALVGVLRRTAFVASDGGLNWIGVRGDANSSVRGLHPIRWELYGGRCGVALFFAAFEHCGRGGPPSLVQRMLNPLVRELHAGSAHRETGRTAGAAGLGGIVYALTRIAQWIGSESLLMAAASAAHAITPSPTVSGEEVDVITGLAGEALGLLALHHALPADWLLDRALGCGRRLVQRSSRIGDGRRGWKSADGRVHHGFAHGSAGIAYALARVHAATGDPLCRLTALDAVGPLLPIAPPHWTDNEGHQEPLTPAMRQSWCRGEAGLGLARIGISRALNCPEVLDGLAALLGAAAPHASPLGHLDHLCCGNIGRVDLMIEAAASYGEPSLASSARQLAEQVVERASRRGTYAVSGVDDVFSPGFYDGLAGLGYEMLRLNADDLPSVLLWE